MNHVAEQFLQHVELSPALQAQMAEADGDIHHILAIASEAGFDLKLDALEATCAAWTARLAEVGYPEIYFDHPMVYFG